MNTHKKHPLEETKRNKIIAKEVQRLLDQGYGITNACLRLGKNGAESKWDLSGERIRIIYNRQMAKKGGR